MLLHKKELRIVYLLFLSGSHIFGCVLFRKALLARVIPAPGKSAKNISVSACSDIRSPEKP